MSDSGFGQISSPTPPAAQNGGRGNGQLVQIVTLPEGLQNSARAVRIAGEVTQQNANGTLRIATAEGNIDVQVRGNRTPTVGQRVEVELPAGRPPRQATVREAPAENVSRNAPSRGAEQNAPTNNVQAQRSAASPTQQVQINTQPVAQTSNQTAAQNAQTSNASQAQATVPSAAQVSRPVTPQQPIPAALQASVSENISTTSAPARPLPIDAIVRLLAVPPAQAQSIAADFVQGLPQALNNTISRVQFSANLIAQNTQNLTAAPFFQTPNTTPLQSTQSLAPLLPQNTAQPISQSILTNSFLQSPTVQTSAFLTAISSAPTGQATTTLTPNLNTSIIPNIQTLTPQSTSNLLQTQITSAPISTAAVTTNIAPPNTLQNATLINAPITFDPTNPNAQANQRIGQIDIQILRITPPQVQITPTTINASAAIIPAATPFTAPLISINSAATLTAQVTGFTPQGLPLVTVQGLGARLPQSFILQFSGNNLQLGTQLQIIPRTGIVASTVTPPITNLTNPLLQGFQWPALNDLYSGLSQLGPQAAAGLTRALPNAGNPAQLSAAGLMFIAAVKAGDISVLFGDKKIELIQRANQSANLLRLIGDASSTTARAPTVDAPVSSDWRAVPLPMFWENEIHKITLYTRREDQNDQQDNKGEGQTRFVFDLSLSRIGDVQLDGLLRDKRLDLVVRTHNAFSTPMQQTMRQAYSSALGSTDLTGEVNFQGSTKNWVHVLEKNEQLGVDA